MITIKNLTYTIKGKLILSDITLNIKDGEKVLIMGPSGSGKSTLLNLIMKNISPTKGTIYYDKENINKYSLKQTRKYRKDKVIMIRQFDDLFDNLSVLDNLELYYYKEDVVDILSKANMLDYKDRIVSTLSGGQRQRIAILKACLSSCNTILCDEITSALDYKNANKIIDFILKMFSDKTIIFISHDYNLLKDKVDHYYYLDNHRIISEKTINDVSNKNIIRKHNKEKKLFKNSLINGLKKIKVSIAIIMYLLVVTIIIVLNFQNIFNYLAKKSYESYFDYNVLFINDYDNDLDDNRIYKSLDEYFKEEKVIINNTIINNVEFRPFYNDGSSTSIVINRKYLTMYDIDTITSISIGNIILDNIDIIDEDGMFSTKCIYYDICYYSSFINSNSNEYYIVNYDLSSIDDRFTNNPLFNKKEEDKPYLSSNALYDYLTYKMIFESIYSIVSSFFLVILFFSIFITILLNISLLLKEIKQIAILLSRGYHSSLIILTYIVPITIYSIPLFIASIFINNIIISILLVIILEILSILISFYIIKSKNLNELLKEDILV